MQQPTGHDVASARSAMSKLIEGYNPGITLLVLLWTIAFALRVRLLRSGPLVQPADNALKSLLLVIPIMLAGWAFLAIIDRRFRLGWFR